MLDLGTGDGRAVLARARQDPTALVIGLDASVDAMAESSIRAARSVRKGGIPNALFVAAAVEQPPPELCGLADEVTIHAPWGSLLRGALAVEGGEPAAAGIASVLGPHGVARVIVSVTERDHLALPPDALEAAALGERWSRHGLALTSIGPADVNRVLATGSSWARRLGIGRQREAFALELRRIAPRSSDPGSG